jgi:preprotein translocase subunit SecF
MEIFRVKKDIPFMKYRSVSAVVSTSIFLLSIIFLSIKGLNLGVDFTGGTIMEVSYPEAANIENIRETLKSINLKDTQLQNFGAAQDVLIRLPIKADLSIAELSEKVASALRKANNDVKVMRVESVGAQVGDELYEKGALAILFVIIGIMLYLWLRFEWRFAVAAIVANMHDVVIILGFFCRLPMGI